MKKINEIIVENNEFLCQFELKLNNSLSRIEYIKQDGKFFLTKLLVPDEVQNPDFEDFFISKVLEIVADKKLKVVPISPKIVQFIKRNKLYEKLLPAGIKL